MASTWSGPSFPFARSTSARWSSEIRRMCTAHSITGSISEERGAAFRVPTHGYDPAVDVARKACVEEDLRTTRRLPPLEGREIQETEVDGALDLEDVSLQQEHPGRVRLHEIDARRPERAKCLRAKQVSGEGHALCRRAGAPHGREMIEERARESLRVARVASLGPLALDGGGPLQELRPQLRKRRRLGDGVAFHAALLKHRACRPRLDGGGRATAWACGPR